MGEEEGEVRERGKEKERELKGLWVREEGKAEGKEQREIENEMDIGDVTLIDSSISPSFWTYEHLSMLGMIFSV